MKLSLELAAAWPGFRLAATCDLALEGVTALFGPSGSGKTTVLQAIAGFRPGLGRVAVGGEIWQDAVRTRPPHRRPVGMVFQEGRLFDHLDVAGNLAFAWRRRDRTGPAIGREDVVRLLGLDGLMQARTVTLSGGERQRVAIARALLTCPRLMLMDEPLAALDRARKADILPLIAALPARFGVPVLLVSHQIDEIVQVADSLLSIRAGAFQGFGPTAEMLEAMDPGITGRFEAGSLIEGPVVDRSPEFAMIALDIGGARLWMPDTGGAGPGDRVRVRLRARDVSLALGPVEGLSMRNQLPATVRSVETEPGAFAEVRLDCGGQTLRARVSRMAVADLGLVPGLPVVALIKSMVFDRRLTR